MVRTSEQCPSPPTTAAIVGGFVSLPVGHLLAVWFACQGIDLGIGHFRAWIASIEMVKRRAFAPEASQTAYGFAELATLLDLTQERARLLVRDLVAAGLLTWSGSAITFPEPTTLPDHLLAPFSDSIGRGKGQLVLPRRPLRYLARGASTATIAVALGALFRCLSCRRGQRDSRGRFKASWIARAFRVDRRQVKDARKRLVGLGWLAVDGDDRQGAMNRWGRSYRIDLGWDPPARTIARSAPPPADPTAPSAPPLPDRDPLREEFKNQNPASGGPAGVQLSEREGEKETLVVPDPPVATRTTILPSPTAPVVTPSPAPAPLDRTPVPASAPARTLTSPAPGSPGVPPSAGPAAAPRPCPAVLGPAPAQGSISAPRLEDVRLEDLKDTAQLMDLLGQAVARGVVTGSEVDRLRFVGAAEHALAIGQGNKPGLFIHLVRGQLWRYLTQEDEDRANGRIKAFLRGPAPPRVASLSWGPPARPVLSEDARVVMRVRAALASASYRGDPFPQVKRHDPSWTRERWDRALAELEGYR